MKLDLQFPTGVYGIKWCKMSVKSFHRYGHELSVPHSPQQNGVAERMNRMLMESARSIISHAGLPNSYWVEAVGLQYT